MRYVKARYGQVSEALAHKRYALDQHPALSWAGRAVRLADAVFHSLWMDFYGRLEADCLILGGDTLANLISGYVMASKGLRVVIVEDDFCRRHGEALYERFTEMHPSTQTLISDLLGIEVVQGKSLAHNLSRAVAGLVDEQGKPLVERLLGCHLYSDPQSPLDYFAQPAEETFYRDGLCELRFWDPDDKAVFGTEIGKCPQFRAQFKSVILTSFSDYASLCARDERVLCVADALKPLSAYEYFRASDRLRELLEIIKVLGHGQNVSASDQHHA